MKRQSSETQPEAADPSFSQELSDGIQAGQLAAQYGQPAIVIIEQPASSSTPAGEGEGEGEAEGRDGWRVLPVEGADWDCFREVATLRLMFSSVSQLPIRKSGCWKTQH